MKKIIFVLTILLFFTAASAVDFQSILFTFWAEDISGQRGETVELPVNVKNLGILTDKYIVTIIVPPQYSSLVSVLDKQITTGEIKFNELQKVPTRIIFLSSTHQAQLNVTVQSSNCQTQECSPAIASQSMLVYVRSGVASLPDFNPLGILLILLASSAILYKKFN